MKHAVALVLALVLALAVGGTAGAKTSLVSSVPADGSTWTELPAEVRLNYSGAIIPEMSTVSLLDERGRVVSGTRQRSEGERTLVLELPALPLRPGRATFYVQAQVVGRDLQVTRDRITFTVQTGPAGAGEEARRPGVSWAVVGLVAVAGAGLVALLVLRGQRAA